MAKITINETLTQNVTSFPTKSNAVYIPGFSSKSGVTVGTPILCETVDEFEDAFGTTPYKFTSDQSYPTGFLTGSYKTGDKFCKENDVDKSYIIAKTLLKLGLPVYYEVPAKTSTTTPIDSVAEMYSFLSDENTFKRLEDKGDYILRFITSGAYPLFEYKPSSKNIAERVINCAATRGDAIAIIDHTLYNSRVLTGTDSVYGKLQDYFTGNDNTMYGAMYTPYATYNIEESDVELPGSFAYLASYAVSIQSNASWYAVAGVTRGSVPFIKNLSQAVTNSIADTFTARKGVSINPITEIKPYGLVIWGNRTLKNNGASETDLTAQSFMNIRQLVSDVKRVVYLACKRLTFEQNNDLLWINFKSLITPTLDTMLHDNGLTSYRLTKQTAKENAKLKATIELHCVEAVEDFEITITLTDTEITE